MIYGKIIPERCETTQEHFLPCGFLAHSGWESKRSLRVGAQAAFRLLFAELAEFGKDEERTQPGTARGGRPPGCWLGQQGLALLGRHGGGGEQYGRVGHYIATKAKKSGERERLVFFLLPCEPAGLQVLEKFDCCCCRLREGILAGCHKMLWYCENR